MVEVWFKYGSTEIFADLEESVEVLNPSGSRHASYTDEIRRCLEDVVEAVVVDYVYAVDGYDEAVVSTVGTCTENFPSVEVYVSSWRYADAQTEKSLYEYVRKLLPEVKKIQPLTGTDKADPSKTLLFSPAVYWGGRVIGPKDLWKKPSHGLRLVSPVVGCGGYVAEVMVGEFEEVSQMAVRRAEELSKYSPNNPADVVLVGGPGHPVDKRFSACLHMASSVSKLEPGKVVVFMFESSEGLGEEWLLKLAKGEHVQDSELVEQWKDWKAVAEKHKVVLVTALPSTVVEKILNARQADTLDQAVVYARRVKSREARVLAVPNCVGTCLEGF
ncbi:MAG: hypothetical protein QW420_05695 [Candidatus Caldarchaeum sp.]